MVVKLPVCWIRIIFLVPLSFGMYAAFAAGQGDPLLSQADSLVKQKRFHEAMHILSDFIKEDDIRFDAAQERIRKILRNNEYYHQLVNKLMDVVETTPDDYTTIIAIADDLRKIDAPYDDSVRRFVGRIQEIARFTVNRHLIERILREGRELIDAGDYLAALRKYQTGFEIYEAELWESRFDAGILQEARSTLNTLSQSIDSVARIQPQINAVRSSLTGMTNREDSPAVRHSLNSTAAALLPQLDSLIQVKSAMTRAEQFFESAGALPQIEQSSRLGRFFFPASALFVRGRGTETIREGMLGAVDALWKSAVLPLNDSFGGISERLYQDSMTATENNNYTQARSNIAAAKEFIAPLLVLSEKSETFVEIDKELPAAAGFNQPIFSLINENIIRFNAMDAALAYFSSAGTIGSRFYTFKTQHERANIWNDWHAGRISSDAAFNEMRNLRVTYLELNNAAKTEMNAIDRDTSALNKQVSGVAAKSAEHAAGETPLAAGLRYYGDSRRIMEALSVNVYDDLLAATEQLYTVANENIKRRLAELEKQYDEGQRLLSGVEIKTEQGDDVLAKYSREAAGVLDSMKSDLLSGIEMGTMLLEEYRQDNNQGTDVTARISSLESETASHTARLKELELQEARDLEMARERAGRAESLRVDGEQRLAESKKALGENNFEMARERLEYASSRWNESLELQENPAIRRAWLNQLDPLAKEIARLEYEYTLREVRGLIDNSRERYFAGNFDRAEEALMRAENRWGRVSADPHDEIIYWLGLVRAALSLRSGSNVPVTAPLYPDFSQLLSDAKKNYNDGVLLLRTNRRPEGIVKFTLAKTKTQEIKLLFPVNQDAGLLDLRIDQVIDPDTFDDTFRQKFVAAVAGTKRQSRESYFELENLAQINPSYPGMAAALTEAKYDVGLMLRPVDNSTERQSTSLLAQAQQIYGRNNRTQLQEVMRLANEALRLNPNNRQASVFLDRVRLNTGSVAVIVADPTAEQSYLSAIREFQQGNGLIAMSIVQRLLQHPANTNNIRFRELQRRIAATL